MSDITPKDPYAAVLAYDPEDFGNWKFYFLIFINHGNLRDIIDGKLTATSGNSKVSSSQRRVSMGVASSEKEGDSVVFSAPIPTSEEFFHAKNAQLFRVVAMAVSKCLSITAKRVATEKLREVQAKHPDNGKLAYEAILKIHENPTLQNKLDAGKQFLSNKMKVGESVADYKLRCSDNLALVEKLNVSIPDLHTTVFIDGLRPEFDTLKTSLYTQDGLTFEQATDFAASHSRRLQDSASTKPNYANLPSHTAFIATGSSAGGDEASNFEIQVTGAEYHAMLAALRSGSSKKRGGLDHDVDAHPDSPTDYEKTLTCDNCRTKGHAKRTCKKRKLVQSNFAIVQSPTAPITPSTTTHAHAL
jgi:hypothetical protein